MSAIAFLPPDFTFQFEFLSPCKLVTIASEVVCLVEDPCVCESVFLAAYGPVTDPF